MNIFITGGISGLGLEVGKIFSQKNFRVGVCSFQEKKLIPTLPSNFFYYQADVTKQDQLHQAVKEFMNDHGVIDIMIANAGINMPKTSIPSTELGNKVIHVNVLGLSHSLSAILPTFLEHKKGHFVAISSLSALNGLPGMSYYGASKAFVGSFCESLAIDLKPYNINVTCIYPGFINTTLTKNNTHPMPFLMNTEMAANKIVQAIEDKKESLYFPFVPALFMGLLRRLPRFIYFPLMKKDLLKLKQS